MSRSQMMKIFFLSFSFVIFASCLGIGNRIKLEETFTPIPYDQAFDLALKSAREMHQECKRINFHNFPIIVDLGTSKSRGVITLHYKYDPTAGNVCSPPPEPVKSLAMGFVPHFGAEFYMHVRFAKTEGTTKGVSIEISQSKGVKKEEFANEMERLKEIYLKYLKRNWK